MCTIVIATRVFQDAPLIVAANRDEAFDRPAQGPAIRSFNAGPKVLAPRDLAAGGTWVGLNRHGVFVAITNRHTNKTDPQRTSRGKLVAQALSFESVSAAEDWAHGVDVSAYNPFHLAVLNTESGFVLWNHEDRSRLYQLEPGVHVLTERFAGARAGPGARLANTSRPERVLSLVEAWKTGGNSPSDAALQKLLADHTGAGFEDLKIAIDGLAYGTRSALTFRLSSEGPGSSSFTWSEGPPAAGTFVDSSELLRQLNSQSS